MTEKASCKGPEESEGVRMFNDLRLRKVDKED